MKYLFMVILFVVGCGKEDLYKLVGIRKFAVGDCLVASNKAPEKWELHHPDYEVTEIGNKQYRIKFIALGDSDIYSTITFGYLWEGFYQKVNCK
jgi:hypothetical protein